MGCEISDITPKNRTGNLFCHQWQIHGGQRWRYRPPYGWKKYFFSIFLLFIIEKIINCSVVITIQTGVVFHFSGTCTAIRSKKISIIIHVLRDHPWNSLSHKNRPCDYMTWIRHYPSQLISHQELNPRNPFCHKPAFQGWKIEWVWPVTTCCFIATVFSEVLCPHKTNAAVDGQSDDDGEVCDRTADGDNYRLHHVEIFCRRSDVRWSELRATWNCNFRF